MTTFTALTTLTGRAAAEALGAAMERLIPEPTGIGVFEIEDGSGMWEIGGYFIDRPDAAGLALLATAFAARPFVVSEVPDQDWVAHVQRQLPPVEAGRFFVYGNHDADKVPADRIALLIEAAMAFGTGHHGTTLGCLLALDRLIDNGFSPRGVADIGSGTAVLAMAAASVFSCPVLDSDIDEVAVEVALTNVMANNLGDRVHCIEATGFEHRDIAARAPFDLIFANILKGPLLDLAPAMSKATNPGGYVILSGLLNEQADEVIAEYHENGYNLWHHDKIVDWTTLTLGKTKA
ncbi:MAG: 50S ribosomal protein L11 methyltransferase [Marinosulfonomonas sp.]|nr:50S ribosomal protein L11 methyltransferase [Marinosulfonomonas sp.]